MTEENHPQSTRAEKEAKAMAQQLGSVQHIEAPIDLDSHSVDGYDGLRTVIREKSYDSDTEKRPNKQMPARKPLTSPHSADPALEMTAEMANMKLTLTPELERKRTGWKAPAGMHSPVRNGLPYLDKSMRQHSVASTKRADNQKSLRNMRKHRAANKRVNAFDCKTGFLTMGPDSQIHMVDEVCAEIFGYTPQEMIGKNVEMLMPEPYRAVHQHFIDQYMETGKTHIIGQSRQVEAVHSSGTLITVRLTVSDVRTDGDVNFYATVEPIVEDFGKIVAGTDGKILGVNEVTCEIFCYTSEEMIGQPLSIIMPIQHKFQHQKYIEKYLETGESKVIGKPRAMEAKTRTGHIIPISLLVVEKTLSNKERVFMAEIRDVGRNEIQGVISFDEKGIIRSYNHLTSFLLGLEQKSTEYLGRNISDVFPQVKHLNYLPEHGSVDLDTLHSDGTSIRFKCNIDQVKHDDSKLYIMRLQRSLKQHFQGHFRLIDRSNRSPSRTGRSHSHSHLTQPGHNHHLRHHHHHHHSGHTRHHHLGSHHHRDRMHDRYMEDSGGSYSSQSTGPDHHSSETLLRNLSGVGDYIGNYQVMSIIGAGTYGAVLKAKHRSTRRNVAIKIIDTNVRNAAHIHDELRIWKVLKHVNIVQLCEIISRPERLFLVCEYIPGKTLLEFVSEQVHHNKMLAAAEGNEGGPIGGLSEEQAQYYFGGIVSAVRYMHNRGIVHRDLKLDNCLVERGTNTIKVFDFGFSTMQARHEDGYDVGPCGSVPYMAPEIIKGNTNVGPEVDMWALGVMLYLLLRGKFPFGSVQDILQHKGKLMGSINIHSPQSRSTEAIPGLRPIPGTPTGGSKSGTPNTVTPTSSGRGTPASNGGSVSDPALPVYLQDGDNFSWPLPVVMLLNGLLANERSARLTIADLVQQPWVSEALTPDTANADLIDDDILFDMARLGIPRKLAIRSIRQRTFNHVYATYQLLDAQRHNHNTKAIYNRVVLGQIPVRPSGRNSWQAGGPDVLGGTGRTDIIVSSEERARRRHSGSHKERDREPDRLRGTG